MTEYADICLAVTVSARICVCKINLFNLLIYRLFKEIFALPLLHFREVKGFI